MTETLIAIIFIGVFIEACFATYMWLKVQKELDEQRYAMLSAQEVAKKLKVSDETVRRMVRRGELAGRRVGRLYRIDAEAVR